jgi:hypothetical protein
MATECDHEGGAIVRPYGRADVDHEGTVTIEIECLECEAEGEVTIQSGEVMVVGQWKFEVREASQ